MTDNPLGNPPAERRQVQPRIGVAATAALLFAACSTSTPAPPPPPIPDHAVEYAVPWTDAFPSDIAVDSVGRVWFTDRFTHAIGMFDPESEAFRRIETPTPKSAPYGMITAPDGTIWFTESTVGRLGRLDPATGDIEEVAIEGLKTGPNLLVWVAGELWFAAREEGWVGRYEPATGQGRRYPTDPGVKPYGIAATPSGSIWVSQYNGPLLYGLDPETDMVTPVDLTAIEPRPPQPPDRASRAGEDSPPARFRRARPLFNRIRRLTSDGAGRLWFSDLNGNRISSYDPHTEEIEHYGALAQRTLPYGIGVDPWGRVWFGETGRNAIVVLDPVTWRRTTIRLAEPPGAVRQIAFDAVRGRVWLPISDAGRIGRIDLGQPPG